MIRQEIKRNISAATKRKFGEVSIPELSIEIPENPAHGDYATNAALVLAKVLKKNPMEIAEEIVGELRIKNQESSRVEAVAPGFLNFYLKPEILYDALAEILKKKERYGILPKKNKKIQVEFVSANPTGPLTLANGRGGFLGDVLARVLSRTGYRIEREYYVNDAGNQVIMLGKSLLASCGAIPEEEVFYKGSYIKEWAHAHKGLVKKYKDDPEKLGKLAAKDFLKEIRAVLEKKSGIRFDRFTSEDSDIRKKGLTKKALALFSRKGFVYKKEGAVWLRTTDFGDDKDRVLVTSDGFPTYFLADSGHYLETKQRKFSAKINIVGPDHYGYVKRIQAAAKIIGIQESRVIVTQAIRLLRAGQEAKMSKRRGEFVAFEELIDEVGLDAARYFFLEKSPDTHIDFNLDLAREHSVKNPVYYVQYAYARIASIIRKSQKSKVKSQNVDLSLLSSPEEFLLIKKLIQFSEIVEDTATDLQVHRMTRYAYELARVFHNFYEKHRVMADDGDLTAARLRLVDATRIILGITLGVLGISAPKKM